MDKLNIIISENLKKIRDERKFSLDQLSKLTGVSKSMLGQIERGEVNPSVSTIWKITNGLKISFSQLMHRPEMDIEIVKTSDMEPLIEDNGKFRNYPIFPYDGERHFEMYTSELDPQGFLDSEPHPQGTQEFLTVFSGEVIVEIEQQTYVIQKGDSIHFKADVLHSYRNVRNTKCEISMVIYYPL